MPFYAVKSKICKILFVIFYKIVKKFVKFYKILVSFDERQDFQRIEYIY